MELNSMLCVGRSSLSGLNEGATRRKLFPSQPPSLDTTEIVDEPQHSRNDLRSNILTTPPKRSILRGQAVNSGHSSPSSVRSVRFSRDDEDFSIECAKLHVNQTTQTVEKEDLHDTCHKITDVGKDMNSFIMQSGNKSYIELVGSPKAHKIGLRGCTPTDRQDTNFSSRNKQIPKMSKSVQTLDPQVPDGCKIIQNMDISGPIAKAKKQPDGNKIVQNLELGTSKSKYVQTDDTSLSETIATQTPAVPDGNKIIRNLELEFSLPKYASANTQTPAVPDGLKIIQNIELDTPRSSVGSELVYRNVAVQTGTTNSSSTQTPAVSDGSRIIQNMELDTPRSMDRIEPGSRDISVQTGKASNSSTQTSDIPDGRKIIQNMELDTPRSMDRSEPGSRDASVQTASNSGTQMPDIPDGRKIIQNMDLLTHLEQDAFCRSVSVQTKTDHEDTIQDGSKIIQNMELERIRSPSPDTMDGSFGFDVDVSSISTQTNPDKPNFNEVTLQHEPVLIYNKTDTGHKPIIINYNDDVREEEKSKSTKVSPTVSRSSMVDSDYMQPERLKFNTKREDKQTEYNWEQNKNTQNFNTVTPKSAQPYSRQQKSVYEKLLNLSYPAVDIPKRSSGMLNGVLGMPTDQWIAPTVSTNLHTKSTQSNKQDTTQTAARPINTYKPYIPEAQKLRFSSRQEDLPVEPKLFSHPFNDDFPKGNIKKSHIPPPDSSQAKYSYLYKKKEETCNTASKLNTFSRSPIDVYSFDPESVKQSKKLLSSSTTKESITKNRFVKGIDLYTPAPRPAGSVSVSSHASSRPRSHDPYVGKINASTRTSHDVNRIGKKEHLHSSRYSDLYKPTVTGFGPVPVLHAPTSNRSRSVPSRITDNRSNWGTKHTSLTPALNLIRSSAIRKSAMNASSAKHTSRPSSASSLVPSSTYLNDERSSVGKKPYQESEHRSRSREINRGTNSRLGQSGFSMASEYERRGKAALYLESLTDASNARPRSRERSLKSVSPSSSSTEHIREHNRSRSSSATREIIKDETVTMKPPLPSRGSRKVSQSPNRRPSPVNQGYKPSERERFAVDIRTTPSPQPGQVYLSHTNNIGDSNGSKLSLDRLGNLCQASNKLTIGAAPLGIADPDCVYLDERTINRIIESANLC